MTATPSRMVSRIVAWVRSVVSASRRCVISVIATVSPATAPCSIAGAARTSKCR